MEMYRKTRGRGFGAEVKRRIMLGTYALSAGYYDAYYLKAQKVRSLIARDFAQAFEQVDAIVTPTSPVPAFRLGERTADPLAMYLADIYTVTGSLAGVPGISVPVGQDHRGASGRVANFRSRVRRGAHAATGACVRTRRAARRSDGLEPSFVFDAGCKYNSLPPDDGELAVGTCGKELVGKNRTLGRATPPPHHTTPHRKLNSGKMLRFPGRLLRFVASRVAPALDILK